METDELHSPAANFALTKSTRVLSKLRAPKEAGLIGVVLILGLMLTIFGGTIKVRNPGTDSLATVNKFLRADNLDKLAKNTSFFAIMAVGATFVIISGGIDLSVGSVYCLAAIFGAMFLHYCGPNGSVLQRPRGGQFRVRCWFASERGSYAVF